MKQKYKLAKITEEIYIPKRCVKLKPGEFAIFLLTRPDIEKPEGVDGIVVECPIVDCDGVLGGDGKEKMLCSSCQFKSSFSKLFGSDLAEIYHHSA